MGMLVIDGMPTNKNRGGFTMSEKTLIIHDNEGYILTISGGQPVPREPIGVPFLWVDVPEGKRLKSVGEVGVDVSVSPHQAILDDIPPNEIDILKEENVKIKESMAELAELILGGM